MVSSLTKCVLIFTIIVTTIGYHEAKKTTKNIYFLHSEVSFDHLYIQDHTLVIGPDRGFLDITLNVVRSFSSDPWLEIILSGINRKGNIYRPLFTYDINACNILGKEGTQFNNFVTGWTKNVLKYGNFPKSCPVPKGNYSWRGLRAEKLNIPPFLPGGKYRAVINTYFRKGSLKDFINNLTLIMELK